MATLSDAMVSLMNTLMPADTPLLTRLRAGQSWPRCLEFRVEPGTDPERAAALRAEAGALEEEEQSALRALGIDPDEAEWGHARIKAAELIHEAYTLDDHDVCIRWEGGENGKPPVMVWGTSDLGGTKDDD